VTFGRKTYIKPPRAEVTRSTIPLCSPVRMATVESIARIRVEVPKEEPLQHQGYINRVRAMACIRCKRPPRSQFCHSDEGKGAGIKSDCRNGWPGCAACHYAVGTERIYPKNERRRLEAEYAKKTRDAIRAAGLWPKRLPLWRDDTE
jgi:hypothetical protein